MFHAEYAFHTASSARMQQHFQRLAAHVLETYGDTRDQPFIVEIGSNDGTFLSHFVGTKAKHLGVEPSESVAQIAQSRGVRVWPEFFSLRQANQIVAAEGHADVIVAANVLCHIGDICDVAAAVSTLLNPGGIFVSEDPYLGSMLTLGSYDQIYDEHVFMFSALSMCEVFGPAGLSLIDVEKVPTHGGSMRYTFKKGLTSPPTERVDLLLAQERSTGLDRIETFHSFAQRVDQNARELREQITDLVSSGARVAALGATSKSTTIYNYADLGPDLIEAIFDTTPSKIGKLSPGKHIPVVDASLIAQYSPDVLFLAAWNHADEVRHRYQSFSQSGGKWLTHIPGVRVLPEQSE
jgi:methylation protein EvaC